MNNNIKRILDAKFSVKWMWITEFNKRSKRKTRWEKNKSAEPELHEWLSILRILQRVNEYKARWCKYRRVHRWWNREVFGKCAVWFG